MVKIKIRRWYGWKTITGVSYEWLSGRTTAAGIVFVPDESPEGGHIQKKIADVNFPLQLAVTLKDGTIEYIPDIVNKRIKIWERKD